MAARDRRNEPRIALALPVRVSGVDEDGTAWEEVTSTDDASFGGASFALRHGVETGRALQLAMPLPKRFRRYDLTEPSYQVFALVRDLMTQKSGTRVGVLFLGKQAPKDYDTNPAQRYLLPSDPPAAPQERRKRTRLAHVSISLKLRRIAANQGTAQEERTVAENLGKGGARVVTSLPLTKGEIVMVEELGGAFRTRAEVCNVYIGEDRVPRLNLHFLDAEAPDRLLGTS
jgi:hypothetical protein